MSRRRGFRSPKCQVSSALLVFEGIAAENVEVTENVVAIEARAFADCLTLRQITIPAQELNSGLNVVNSRTQQGQGSCKIIVH